MYSFYLLRYEVADRSTDVKWACSDVLDVGTILSYARKIRKGLRRSLCQGQGHAELKNEKSRVEVFIYDFPKLHHSSPNSFGANGQKSL